MYHFGGEKFEHAITRANQHGDFGELIWQIHHHLISTFPPSNSWLWEAACKIRGPIDAPKYKDYILPLIFLKRLSNVFADEVEALARIRGMSRSLSASWKRTTAMYAFYIPPKSRWSHLAQLSTVGLGEALTDAVRGVSRRESPFGRCY